MLTETETKELIAINEATQVVFNALLELSDNARQRVLQSVMTQFGLSGGGIPRQSSLKEYSMARPSTESITGDFSADRTMSPKSFMLEKSPRSDVERVACLAYYLTHYRDTPHFKTVEISKLNTEAAQQKLSNPSYSVSNAAKMGYLVPSVKGQKQLSAAGELFVEALPDRDKAKEAMIQARPRKSTRKKQNSGGKNA